MDMHFLGDANLLCVWYLAVLGAMCRCDISLG